MSTTFTQPNSPHLPDSLGFTVQMKLCILSLLINTSCSIKISSQSRPPFQDVVIHNIQAASNRLFNWILELGFRSVPPDPASCPGWGDASVSMDSCHPSSSQPGDRPCCGNQTQIPGKYHETSLTVLSSTEVELLDLLNTYYPTPPGCQARFCLNSDCTEVSGVNIQFYVFSQFLIQPCSSVQSATCATVVPSVTSFQSEGLCEEQAGACPLDNLESCTIDFWGNQICQPLFGCSKRTTTSYLFFEKPETSEPSPLPIQTPGASFDFNWCPSYISSYNQLYQYPHCCYNPLTRPPGWGVTTCVYYYVYNITPSG